jgi:hypothetical protein
MTLKNKFGCCKLDVIINILNKLFFKIKSEFLEIESFLFWKKISSEKRIGPRKNLLKRTDSRESNKATCCLTCSFQRYNLALVLELLRF